MGHTMRKLFPALCLLLLAAAATPLRSETLQLLAYPERTVPGDIVTAELAYEQSDEYQRVFVSLVDQSGKVVTETESFSIGRTEHEYALLGLPGTLASGDYRLEVHGSAGEERSLLFTGELRVDERSFVEETIPLRKSLTELRKEPDPKKIEQGREIHRIYHSFRREAVFATERWAVPIDEYKYVTSRFGDRRIYRYSDGGTAKSVHTGVDLAAPSGTPVGAAAPGQVVLAKNRVISGYSVVIEHLPGVYSVYFHLDDLAVEKGQRVEKREIIGTVGMTGLATGPHLHWEVRIRGVAVEPWVLTKSSVFDSISATDTSADNLGVENLEKVPTGSEENEGG